LYVTLELVLKLCISNCRDCPVEWISNPSIEISSGGIASPGPVTLICSSTVSPTTVSELLNTAVTLGESANAN
jgi:hypothetical protein